MSGLNAIEMSSLRPSRRTYVYRVPGGLCPPDPPKFSAWGADASGGREGPGLREEGQALWRTAHRRALGSHFCGALSSRRRGGRYQEGSAPSSRRPPLASRIPKEAKGLTSGHFYFNQHEDISIAVRHAWSGGLASRPGV